MTRIPSFLRLALLLSVPVLTLAACEGGDGAVCQLNADCSSGLLCCKGSTSLTDRGTCAATCGAIDAGPRDMNVPDVGVSDSGGTDAGPIDAGREDAMMSEDLGAGVDMSMPLDLGVDLGSVDAGSAMDLGESDAGSSG
jgi:hypothetical protein